MQTGFETIGKAILTLYDGGRPVLVTDPWFTPQACFGSWGQPRELPVTILPAADFGDDWNDKLDADERELASRYFRATSRLATHLDYINLRVGGQDHVIRISERKYDRGVTFEAPRNSLMTAIRYEVFDDMLIANFMKTTLHGNWGASRLYPDFMPYVAKHADNGLARCWTI